jgi:hypothetical protein
MYQRMMNMYTRVDDVELDGAYFGTTFAHLLLMQYPELVPPPPILVPEYTPRVFGFRVRSMAVHDANIARKKKEGAVKAVKAGQQGKAGAGNDAEMEQVEGEDNNKDSMDAESTPPAAAPSGGATAAAQ